MDSQIIAPGATLQKLGGGFTFAEGPAAHSSGEVYFTDQPNNRIVKWTPGTTLLSGSFKDWLKPCNNCNGMRFDCHGNIIACADLLNQLWSITLDKKLTVLVKEFEGKLLNGPNDIWPAPNGGIYLTDPLYPRDYWTRDPAPQQAHQNVFYLDPSHRTLTIADGTLTKPNGIIGTRDGRTLYVSDIGANKTYRYELRDDGSLINRALFCELGSDGMTLDNLGNVYLTGHGVTVFNDEGKQIERIDVPGKWTGNLCFAGPNHNLLFICASTSVYGLEMAVTAPL